MLRHDVLDLLSCDLVSQLLHSLCNILSCYVTTIVSVELLEHGNQALVGKDLFH